tara:strand:+ start:302443 stop:303729 length:1287 start_codon:yes stop_codon:yes gene_type:complete
MKSAKRPVNQSAELVIPISRWAVVGLCVAILSPWLIVIALLLPKNQTMESGQAVIGASDQVDASPDSRMADSQVSEEPSSGLLSQATITISPPIEFIEELDTSNVGSNWHFSRGWSAGLDELLAGFGLDAGIREQLRQLSESSPDGIVPVTNDVLQEIPLNVRAKVYDHLSKDVRNTDQFNAFRYCGRSVNAWFRDANLRPELIEQIKTMVYSRGPVHFFADLRLVLPHLQSEFERVQMLKVLSRESTKLVRIKVDPDTDIERLVDYWGRYGRGKDVRPILESLALRSQGGSVDLVHLLPPFARERIYTYPGTANGNLVVKRNSHWTALNFFGETPDDRFASIGQVGETLMNDYYPISGEPCFGDLVCLTDRNGDLFHTAVYLADEIVYTKNGHRVSRPWMLLSIDEMIHYYPRAEPPMIRYFRRKDS